MHPESIRNLLTCRSGQGFGVRSPLCRQMWLVAVVCGAPIWEECNRKLFEDGALEKRKVLDRILYRIFNWLFVGQQREGPSLSSWIFDWDVLFFSLSRLLSFFLFVVCCLLLLFVCLFLICLSLALLML